MRDATASREQQLIQKGNELAGTRNLKEKLLHTERVMREPHGSLPTAPDYFTEQNQALRGDLPLSAYKGLENSDAHMHVPLQKRPIDGKGMNLTGRTATSQRHTKLEDMAGGSTPQDLLLRREREERETDEDETLQSEDNSRVPNEDEIEDRYSQMAHDADVKIEHRAKEQEDALADEQPEKDASHPLSDGDDLKNEELFEDKSEELEKKYPILMKQRLKNQ